jgi:hypothetical protein
MSAGTQAKKVRIMQLVQHRCMPEQYHIQRQGARLGVVKNNPFPPQFKFYK